MVIKIGKFAQLPPGDREYVEEVWIRHKTHKTAALFWNSNKKTLFKKIYNKLIKKQNE